MDILFLLIPLSTVLALLIIGTLAWALSGGQFDDLEQQGETIFEPGERDAAVAVRPRNARRKAGSAGFRPPA
jgi:cbb3-type cytochrome oxidase maturation protein